MTIAERLPEPIRAVPLRGTWAYVGKLGVERGETLDIHVATEAAYRADVVKLGTTEILSGNDVDADRADVDVLASWDHPTPSRQMLTPGSYLLIGGDPVPAGDITVGVWVRMWNITQVDVAQWQWQSVISDIAYPHAARFGILVDEWGRVNAYAGDGGPLRQSRRHLAAATLVERVGAWVPIVASFTSSGVRIYVDGALSHRSDEPSSIPPPGADSLLRIGANLETGVVGNLLDGDIADPFILAGGVDDDFASAHMRHRGLPSFHETHGRTMLGWWPLDDERGASVRDASGHGRHGAIVNHGTWQIGGPSAGASTRDAIARSFTVGAVPYRPELDPDRGHGLRLASDDIVDFRWDVTDRWTVPPDAVSGLYGVRVTLTGQDPGDALVVPFVVVGTTPRRPGSVALVCSTNTWLAYGRRPVNEESIHGMSASFYSVHVTGRPHFYVGMRGPLPMISPYRYDSRRAAANHHGHLVRPERLAEAWLTKEGYAFECITDTEIHARPEVLERFATVMLVGHDEYWSYQMQQHLDGYLSGGGTVLSMSGDTMSQRVAFDESAHVLEARKVHAADPRWLTPDRWIERWCAYDRLPGGTLRSLGSPSYRIIGVSTQGMIDDGVADNFEPFTVLEPSHWLFNEPDAVPMPDGRIGARSLNGPQASGYEFDSDPAMKRLVTAPQHGSVTLAAAIGQESIGTIGPSDRGGDIVYWERPQGGRVLAIGSIAATGSLAVDDGIAVLVRNTLHAFGVAGSDPQLHETGDTPCQGPATT